MYRNGSNNSNNLKALASVKQEREGNGDLNDSNSLSPAPSGSPTSSGSASGGWPFIKTNPNRLLLFCDIVLSHVNYPHAFLDNSANNNNANNDSEDGEQGESESAEENKANVVKNERVAESPLNSVGESARESIRSSTSSTDSVITEIDPEEVDKETFESVTCWCGKPFAGRPMIECDVCLVWYHLKCENVKKNCIPNEFHCSRCKDKKKKKKRPSSSGKDSSRKPAKRMSLESAKKGAHAPAVPISLSATSPEVSSRLNEASTKTATLQIQSSKQSVERPERNGLQVNDDDDDDDDVDESVSTKVNSQPVISKRKGKSLSPSRLARSKKSKKGGKDERRKSSGGALASSTVTSANADINNGMSHLSARLGLPCDDYQRNGEVGAESSHQWPKGGSTTSANAQSQMPPVLPCYGCVGGSPGQPHSPQHSSSRPSYGSAHTTSVTGNNYDGGFSSPLASIPVLQPEVTPQHQSVIMGPARNNYFSNGSRFANEETDPGSPLSSPPSSAYIQQPSSFLESSPSYPSQQMGHSSHNAVPPVNHPYNHHNGTN